MIRRLHSDTRGTAAIELVLVLPLLLVLMLGSVELGSYFWSEHILVKGVRDGAIFAARREIYDCTGGAATVSQAAKDDTEAVVRSGELSGGTDRLPNWDSATFDVTVACAADAGGTAMSGMYSQTGGNVPIVTVTAQLPYRTVISTIGFNAASLNLGAREQAIGTGV
jgi:Flp pilus assembly protein TadG